MPDMLFATPAQIHSRATTEELVALARGAMIDPSIVATNPPFFWRAEISSSRVDAYFTRMAESTLRNFAAEAQSGVSFQNSHATNKLGFGRSLTGVLVGAQGNGVMRVEADFYTIPGLRLHDVSTDDFILGVRAGILSDVSVGFFGGTFRCNICGRDMFRDWDCSHIPGVNYEIKNALGTTVREDVAVAWVEDAHLAEVSVVYDGATPGAAILKAQQEAVLGRMAPTAALLIEQRYRIRLPDKQVQVPGMTLPPAPADTEESMAKQTRVTPAAEDQRETPAVEEQREAPASDAVASEAADLDQRATPADTAGDVQVRSKVSDAKHDDEDDEDDEDEDDVGMTRSNEVVTTLTLDTVELVHPELEQVRGMLIGAGVANPANLVISVQQVLGELRSLRDLDSERAQQAQQTQQAQASAQELGRQLEQVRSFLAGVEAPEGASVLEVVQVLHARYQAALADVQRLSPLADEARAWRQELVEDALAEGVRAYGADFASDTYRPVLEAAAPEVAKRMKADWARIADRQFQSGRSTVDAPVAPATPATSEPVVEPEQPAAAPKVNPLAYQS